MSISGKSTKAIAFWIGVEIGDIRGPATLVVRANRLTIYFGLDYCTLLPEEVISFQEKSGRIHIHHISPHYPTKISFSSTKSIAAITAAIDSIGFQASAKSQVIRDEEGSAIRWQASVIWIILWNILLLSPQWLHFTGVSIPPYFSKSIGLLLAISGTFLVSIIARYSRIMQKIILKGDRSFREISASFSLLSSIMAMFLLSVLLPNLGQIIVLIGVPGILLGHRLRAFITEGV